MISSPAAPAPAPAAQAAAVFSAGFTPRPMDNTPMAAITQSKPAPVNAHA
jgi:hypothetical protein